MTTLGDHAYEYGTPNEFDCYDVSCGRHKARTRPIVGDHEFGTSGAATYYDYFGAAAGDPSTGYYSYDIGSWHVVALNAYCWQAGTCNPAQLQWLREDLAASGASCTLAALLSHASAPGRFTATPGAWSRSGRPCTTPARTSS